MSDLRGKVQYLECLEPPRDLARRLAKCKFEGATASLGPNIACGCLKRKQFSCISAPLYLFVQNITTFWRATVYYIYIYRKIPCPSWLCSDRSQPCMHCDFLAFYMLQSFSSLLIYYQTIGAWGCKIGPTLFIEQIRK